MSLFLLKENPLTNKIEKFGELCDNDIVLMNCYRNRVQFGCTYSNTLERRMDDVLSKMKEDEYPWWVDLLD